MDAANPVKTAPPPKPRGRPPVHTTAEQMERILDATEQLLAQHEMDAHSMAEIARQAGMSKRTLYALVSSKEVLIEKIMERVALKALDLLDAPIGSEKEALDTLARFLVRWIEAAHTPTAINLMRLVIDERKAIPDIGRKYFLSGNMLLRARLVTWMKARVAAGHLKVADPVFFVDVAADHLLTRPLVALALDAPFKEAGGKPAQRVARVLGLFGLA